jgi:hypothetical protein
LLIALAWMRSETLLFGGNTGEVKMAIDLNHDAVITYLDEVLDAFKAGKITKEQARSELQTILAKAAMDNASDLSSSLSNFKQRWNVA